MCVLENNFGLMDRYDPIGGNYLTFSLFMES